MLRYFFHLRDGKEYLDAEGSELEDLAAAQVYSLQMVRQILSTPGSGFWNGQDWCLYVEDDAGRELFRLQLQAVVAPSA